MNISQCKAAGIQTEVIPFEYTDCTLLYCVVRLFFTERRKYLSGLVYTLRKTYVVQYYKRINKYWCAFSVDAPLYFAVLSPSSFLMVKLYRCFPFHTYTQFLGIYCFDSIFYNLTDRTM